MIDNILALGGSPVTGGSTPVPPGVEDRTAYCAAFWDGVQYANKHINQSLAKTAARLPALEISIKLDIMRKIITAVGLSVTDL